MADNFGTRQPRVLEVTDRSFDNVVFQYRTPPLSSEWNLINQIGNQKAQDAVKLNQPSGWFCVGDVLQGWDVADAQTGQVVCDPTYAANTIKLISNNNNYAVVNGWPILVQGVSSVDNNNVITLEVPTGQRFDFVFLEVWRKLVASTDFVYPYGNITKTPYTDNEIVYAPVGAETTKRIQIQYRVRVKSITGVVSPDSDAFSTDTYPQAGRTTVYTGFYPYSSYGASDIGLYIAGDGTDNSKTGLNTVDGYAYAIPMFMVYRRKGSTSVFGPTTINEAYTTKALALTGYRSDRPDEKLADVIYKEDIVDFRHKILTSGKDAEAVVQQTMSKLIAGELTTAIKNGFDADGASSVAFAGASTITKLERINSVGGDNIPNVGTGCGTSSTTFKRRAFCNAEVTLDHNIIEIPIPYTGTPGPWQEGDIVILGLTGLPGCTGIAGDPGYYGFTGPIIAPDVGELVSVDGCYSLSLVNPEVSGVYPVLSNGLPALQVTSDGTNSIVGTSASLLMEYTYKYYASTAGLHDVPKSMLEVNKGVKLPIATRDHSTLLRFDFNGDLLQFSGGISTTDFTDERDYVRYAGGNYTENYRYGHEMVIYRTTDGSGIVTLSLTDSKLNGYYILGVKQVEVTTPAYDSPSFRVERNVTTVPTYAITNYVVTVVTLPNTEIKITLETGSKFRASDVDPYAVAESFKYFEISKQGKGVIDTYETIEVIAEETSPGIYTVDTEDKPIISLCTQAAKIGSYVEGSYYAFKYDTSDYSIPVTLSAALPILSDTQYTDGLPTKVAVTAAAGLVHIRVPVLVHSYVESSEVSYNFYYYSNPYQGILSSTVTYMGKFMAEGPAVITTLGSGAVRDYTYNAGKATFTQGSRSVIGSASLGISPLWSSYVQAGDFIADFIHVVGDPLYYRILMVVGDTSILLAEAFVDNLVGPQDYEIIRIDVPADGIRNVVDTLPAHGIATGDVTDSTCYSDAMDFGYAEDFSGSLYSVLPAMRINDPLNAVVNDFYLGDSGAAKRGRNAISLTIKGNTALKLGGAPYIKYLKFYTALDTGHGHKVYQAYLFNKTASNDTTGRLYLAVISGEKNTDTQSALKPFFSTDTIDLFELVGRPILKTE